MKLTDFRRVIPKVVLTRGAEYTKNDRVTEVSEESEGVWRAEVEGRETYIVRIETLERGDIECMCTCPNDEDDVCEHVAAVLLTLEAMMLEGQIGKAKKRKAPAKKKETKPEKLRRLLGRMPPEALLDLVMQLADEDPALANRLILLVDDEAAKPADYKRVIKDALKAGRGSTGYVNTTGARRVAAVITNLLDQAEEASRNGFTARAATIVQVVSDELNAAVGQVNDPNATLDAPFNRATLLLAELARATKDKDRVDMLEYVTSRGLTDAALNEGNGFDLLTIATWLVENGPERTRLDELLRRLEAQYGRARSWDGGYAARYEKSVELQVALLKRFEGPEAVRAFMLAHSQSFFIRTQLIKLFIEENEPARALELVEKGLQQARKAGDYAMAVEYRKAQIHILELMGDTAGLIRAAQEIWLDSRNPQDFAHLKAMVPPADWPAVRKDLASRLKHVPRLAAWMWTEEGEWGELLKLVRADLDLMYSHRTELEAYFPAEMAAIYEKRIHSLLATNYEYNEREVVFLFGYIRALGQHARADAIIARINQKYPNRKAIVRKLTTP